MSNKIILLSLLFCFVTILSFGQVVGADKDKHGCIVSAGYTYSNIKKDCIRIFEQTILLKNANKTDAASTQTCLLFSKDNKKAEIFVDENKGTILKRVGKKGHYQWKNNTYLVGNTNGYYIKKSGIVIYSQK